MGNKINSTGFRIGVNKTWRKSNWYMPKSSYADTLLEDQKLRRFLEKKLDNAGVAEVMINRSMNKIEVGLAVARPGVVIGKGGDGIKEITQDLQKIANADVKVKVYVVKRPEIVARLVAQNIASQCERRISPKVAMKRAIDAAKDTGAIKGISVWVSGRIRGADIARTEKLEWGNVSRHTLRADIDYALVEAQVPQAGKHGVKVWINKGEKQTYDLEPVS